MEGRERCGYEFFHFCFSFYRCFFVVWERNEGLIEQDLNLLFLMVRKQSWRNENHKKVGVS